LNSVIPFPLTAIYAAKKNCLVEGCNGQTRGKDYCGKHIKRKKPAMITSELRLTMRSDCCKAKCVHGERHEYGEQYCAACNKACQWKVGV
jgi:hypothetical protein